jgi:hypothetical protein
MSIAKRQSHVHAREYWGELDAAPLCEWLNAKNRPASDPVEKLLRLSGERDTPLRAVVRETRDGVSALVRKYKIAVAPVVGDVRDGEWEVHWRLVGKMPPKQGLAFIKLLHLADKGLLARVRQCARKECARWYFARFEHQGFCSSRCQQLNAKSAESWKAKRREYMRQLRATKKQREKKWLAISKAK